MMKTKKLYDSISDIDNKFIEEAQTEQLKKSPVWRKWAIAACLCILAVTAFYQWGKNATPAHNPNAMTEHTPDKYDVAQDPTHDEPDRQIRVILNGIDSAPTGETAMISLNLEDFMPMSEQDSLQYFGVSLPEGSIVPGFEHVTGDHGVYRSDARGVYYDVNSYVYTNGSQSLTLTLRRVFKNVNPSPDKVKNAPDKLEFTKINGRNLALFGYEGEDGEKCVYAEFAQGDVIFTVTARGLESAELLSALENILPPKEDIPEPRTAVGTVTHVDNRAQDYFDGTQHHYTQSHDYITVNCDGECLTVWLPGEANRFGVGDNVVITYTGEPATAYNIWPGQLVSVQPS